MSACPFVAGCAFLFATVILSQAETHRRDGGEAWKALKTKQLALVLFRHRQLISGFSDAYAIFAPQPRQFC
jgi:hypothetical protein